MLAQLDVLLPFSLSLPEDTKFNQFPYEEAGYSICVMTPVRSGRPAPRNVPEEVTIDGTRCFQADVLRIHFRREEFDRSLTSECDPPYEILNRAIRLFLSRLRFVTRASKIHLVEVPNASWKLTYLNDDETK